jgi:hypothetical protein
MTSISILIMLANIAPFVLVLVLASFGIPRSFYERRAAVPILVAVSVLALLPMLISIFAEAF